MKITTIGHACILVEANGLTVLTDPWWRGPCFGAQWWVYPRPFLDAVDPQAIDYIYISHGHHDHYHSGTLNLLSKHTKVIVSKDIGLAKSIRELGFPVIELGNDDHHDLGRGVTARVMETDADDTLLILDDGRETCVNLNDALHAAPRRIQNRFCRMLSALEPTYLYCGYGVASHFPNCYEIPGKDRPATAAARQHYFNEQWCYIVDAIKPRFAFPFAADVVLLEDALFWSNAPTQNSERPTDLFARLFPDAETTVIDQAPGFVIADGRIESDVRRRPLDEDELRRDYADEIARANQHGSVKQQDFENVLELVRQNAETCREYLASFPHDYRCLLRFHNCEQGIEVRKTGREISIRAADADADYDLAYTTRLAYLRWSLTKPYGDEILFVGSGGVFRYASRERVRDGLHVKLRTLMRPHATPPEPRRSVSLVKAVAKRLLMRRDPPSLYDLQAWTVTELLGPPLSRPARS